MANDPAFAGLEADVLGHCPHCSVPIPSDLLLIEYDRRDGHSCYAECPACRDVVRPQ